MCSESMETGFLKRLKSPKIPEDEKGVVDGILQILDDSDTYLHYNRLSGQDDCIVYEAGKKALNQIVGWYALHDIKSYKTSEKYASAVRALMDRIELRKTMMGNYGTNKRHG